MKMIKGIPSTLSLLAPTPSDKCPCDNAPYNDRPWLGKRPRRSGCFRKPHCRPVSLAPTPSLPSPSPWGSSEPPAGRGRGTSDSTERRTACRWPGSSAPAPAPMSPARRRASTRRCRWTGGGRVSCARGSRRRRRQGPRRLWRPSAALPAGHLSDGLRR